MTDPLHPDQLGQAIDVRWPPMLDQPAPERCPSTTLGFQCNLQLGHRPRRRHAAVRPSGPPLHWEDLPQVWRFPPPPGAEVRAVQDPRGRIWVREPTGAFRDLQRGLIVDWFELLGMVGEVRDATDLVDGG